MYEISNVTKGKIFQTFTAIVANLLMVSDGMHYAWSSSVVPQLQSTSSPLKSPLTNNEVTLIEIIYLIGGLVALPYVMYVPDKIGRKYTILAAVLSNLISWILIATTPDVKAIIVARFLAGMSADTGYVSIPMYIAEISDKNIRGSLNGLAYNLVSIGSITIFCTGPFLTLQSSSLIGVFINLLALICFPFLQESPYYYLKRNKVDEAERSLEILRGGINIKQELDELQKAVLRQEEEKGKFKDLITSKGNKKALYLILLIYALQNIAGMAVIHMNVTEILQETSNNISENFGAILFSIVLLIFGIISMFLVDKFGRRKLLIFSGITITITLSILATFSLLQTLRIKFVMENDWIPLFCVLLFAAGLRSGIGFVPLIINGELFPTSVKSKGMTIADGCYLLSGIIVLYSYRKLSETYGMYLPLYILAAGTIFITLILWIKLPETKGKTLEEIQIMLLK